MKNVSGHVSLNKLLIPNKEMSFSEWYNNATGGLYRRLLIGQKIAMQFAELHRSSFAYCDLSGNNIRVNEDEKINSVCMIDIDNIYIPGTDDVSVLGTSRYMAPEILNKQMNPDIFTDSYSLAVILFELLRIGHPYIGDSIEDGTPEQEAEAYKGLYPYIVNRASQCLPADVVFTTKLKELFEKTFIDGKENRLSRIRAYDYALALQRASNLVVKCKSCGNWHYAKPNTERKYICPWCDKEYKKPMRLAFYERYYCKVNEKPLEPPLKDKPIADFILREKSSNSVPLNYIKDSYEVNEDKYFDGYFQIKLGEDGNYYLLNNLGHNIYIEQQSGGYLLVSKPQRIKKDDKIFFTNMSPEKLEEEDLVKSVKGISYRYAIVR